MCFVQTKTKKSRFGIELVGNVHHLQVVQAIDESTNMQAYGSYLTDNGDPKLTKKHHYYHGKECVLQLTKPSCGADMTIFHNIVF